MSRPGQPVMCAAEGERCVIYPQTMYKYERETSQTRNIEWYHDFCLFPLPFLMRHKREENGPP